MISPHKMFPKRKDPKIAKIKYAKNNNAVTFIKGGNVYKAT